jgi:CRISPR-associated protein Cmr2
MNYDFAAHIGQDDENLNAIGTSQETTIRYHQLIAIGRKKDSTEDAGDGADSLREVWKEKYRSWDYQVCTTKIKSIYHSLRQPDLSKITCLPQYSFAISFELTLASAFASRDDSDFYIIDNPIKKDRVLSIPFISASTWKGSLRNTATTVILEHRKESILKKKDDIVIRRLFGNSRAAEDNFIAGRIQCFPTFFLKSGLEIINPHDRNRKVGTNPILIETIPKGTTGTFTLLYIPFDTIGMDNEKIRKQTADDLYLLAKTLRTISMDYGIGAKTSSGFGLLRDEFSDGRILINAVDFPEPEQLFAENDTRVISPDTEFIKYMDKQGEVLPVFLNENGELLSNKQYGSQKDSLLGGSLNEFKKFRQWYAHYGQKWKEQLKLGTMQEVEVKSYRVKSFSELEKTARMICKVMRDDKDDE